MPPVGAGFKPARTKWVISQVGTSKAFVSYCSVSRAQESLSVKRTLHNQMYLENCIERVGNNTILSSTSMVTHGVLERTGETVHQGV